MIDDDDEQQQTSADPANVPNEPLSLDYQRRGAEAYRTKTPLGVQVFAGFAAWLIGLGFVVQVARTSSGRPFGVSSYNATPFAIAAALIGAGALAIWLRIRFRWLGFLPGLLIGFGLTCLVPVGILLIICGGAFR
jgi:hypothetical protein